jgi:hypothetical protein
MYIILVTIFFQYGFRLRTGIVHKTYHNINTGGNWLGPYNIILAKVNDNEVEKDENKEDDDTDEKQKEQDVFVSRYVNTPWTESQLQRPSYANIFESNSHILENIIGTKAINTTIQKVQKNWNSNDNSGNNSGDSGNSNGNKLSNHSNSHNSRTSTSSSITTQRRRRVRLLRQDDDSTATNDENDINNNDDNDGNDNNNDIDPYSKYLQNCDHGDIQPILPRLQLKRTVTTTSTVDNASTPPVTTTTSYSMSIDYSILSLPEKGGVNNDLYKLWPKMKKHLGSTFPLFGPCKYSTIV